MKLIDQENNEQEVDKDHKIVREEHFRNKINEHVPDQGE